MQQINDFFTLINGYLWGWPMIVLLLGTHLFLSVRLRFPQRKILKAIRSIGSNHRNWKYRWSSTCRNYWWARCCFLVLDLWLFRDGYKV